MKPPFRADQVGSLLRPRELAETRLRWKNGGVEDRAFKEIEDRAILEAIRKQEEIGLESITDGEFRRDWWHLDFLTQIEGVAARVNPGPKFGGTEEQPPIPIVTGKLRYAKPIMIDDFLFLKANTKKT